MNISLTWFWLALFFALWTSVLTSVIKRLTKAINPLFLILISDILTLPFIYLAINYLGGMPSVTGKFYLLMFFSGIIDVVGAVSSFFAIRLSPISLISPISSFNPVFTTLIAALILHETLSLIKLLGIFIVVIGSYLLNISDIKKGIMTPFKKLFTNRGVQLFFLANFLWAITPIFQKQAIFETRPQMPIFASFFGYIFAIIFMLPIVMIKVKNIKEQINNSMINWKLFVILSPMSALSIWAAFTAFSLAPLGLVTSVFKFSVLFTILWGFLFFKEERIKERLLGAIVMIAGTILLLK